MVSMTGAFEYGYVQMTMHDTWKRILVGIFCFSAVGCASKTDLYVLQDDVKELRSQSQQSGGQTAEVYSEVEKLRGEVARLKGTIEEMRFKLGESGGPVMPGGMQDSLAADTTGAVYVPEQAVLEKESLPDTVMVQPVLEGGPVVPLESADAGGPVDEKGLYDAGVGYFEKYDYAAARKELGMLVETYPSSSYADDAQYLIAETYYNEKWFEKAILEYQLVIENYPEGDKRPAAYFKQGLAFENIGDSTNARVRYKELVQLYPDSNEAGIVREKLQ